MSVRVYIDGGMGFASITGFDDSSAQQAAEHAVALARCASADPDFVALPAPEPADHIAGLYDPALLELNVEQVVGWASDNISAARAVRDDVIVSGQISVSAGSAALASSTGIQIARNGTNMNLGFFCVVKEPQDRVGSFHDFDAARRLEDIEIEPLAGRVTLRALEYLGGRKIGSAVTTLVLGPLAAFALAGSLASAANAESIQRRRSILTDRISQPVASQHITLLDNGLAPAGLYSAPYDGEGAPRKTVKIIDAGRFVGQLHSCYTANKAKAQNTGHGSRQGGIGHTNLQLQLGSLPAEQIIKQVNDGVYLELGSLSPDPVSGDISTNLDFAFKIENGQLAYPIANAMVAGNVLELLANVDAVSSDCRTEPGNILPTIRIRQVQISAAEDS